MMGFRMNDPGGGFGAPKTPQQLASKVDFGGNQVRVGSCDFVDRPCFLDKRNNPRNHTN